MWGTLLMAHPAIDPREHTASSTSCAVHPSMIRSQAGHNSRSRSDGSEDPVGLDAIHAKRRGRGGIGSHAIARRDRDAMNVCVPGSCGGGVQQVVIDGSTVAEILEVVT